MQLPCDPSQTSQQHILSHRWLNSLANGQVQAELKRWIRRGFPCATCTRFRAARPGFIARKEAGRPIFNSDAGRKRIPIPDLKLEPAFSRQRRPGPGARSA